MEDSKDLSVKIMEALKPILPKGTGFIMVYGEVKTGDLGVTANLSDSMAITFLESAIATIMVEPAVAIEDITKDNASSN